MNWDTIGGNWKQFKGRLQQRWGRITDDQFDVIAGRREQLLGVIQESYGMAQDEAERQIEEWEEANERFFEAALEHPRTRRRRAA